MTSVNEYQHFEYQPTNLNYFEVPKQVYLVGFSSESEPANQYERRARKVETMPGYVKWFALIYSSNGLMTLISIVIFRVAGGGSSSFRALDLLVMMLQD
jgi:hypothetical protein